MKVEKTAIEVNTKAEEVQASEVGCINGHQNKTKETSSESSKGQGSPCSSCGDSCSKCPECCCYDNKNPEAIITTGKIIQNSAVDLKLFS